MMEVSLKTLSRQLGLTEGTVSRALNGYADISVKTRDRVREAADRLGYVPNSTARRLALRNAECVAYVIPWQSAHIADPFLGELLDGISAVLSEQRWDLTVTVPRSEADEVATIMRLAKTGRVNGIIISRTLGHDTRVDALRAAKIPFISHGRTQKSDDHAWLDVDNFEAARFATAHLDGLGHRRIAHIYGPLKYNFSAERLKGYRFALTDAGLELDSALEAASEATLETGHVAMKRLLAVDDPPTAVFCVADVVAIGAMKAIREAGLTPGREVSIIGYDGIPMGEHTYPALTTMAQPLSSAGSQLARMLMDVIAGGDPSSQQQIIPAELVRRQTDSPPI